MWKRLLQAFLPFCVATIISSSSLSNSIAEIERNAIRNFKVELQHTLEGARIRKKRQAGILTTVSDYEGLKNDYWRVGSSVPGTLPYLSHYNITTWTSVFHNNEHQLFVGTSTGDLILFKLAVDNTANVISFIANQYVAQKVKAFSFYAEQWFVVLQSTAEQTWIQMYVRTGETLERRQSIVLDGESEFDLVNVRGVYYMITVTYRRKIQSYYTYEGSVKLYHWTRTQFDEITSRRTFGARSVIGWSMDGALYFAISQETGSGSLRKGSPIYFFNALATDKLALLDELQTKGPKRAAHFSVSGSHYLIFIGSSNAEIYWWSNDQFLPWQTISNTAGAVGVSVITLSNGEVVLVIVLQEEVLFMTLDATGHYIVTFTMHFSAFRLISFQLMFDGKDFYALALSSAAVDVHPHSIWKLGFDQYSLPDVTAMDSLFQCLSSLRDATSELKNEIDVAQADLDRVWVRNKDQVVIADVIIQGSAISSQGVNTIADEIVITTNETTELMPSYLNDVADVYTQEKMILDGQLSDVVFKSASQNVSGPVFFDRPLFVPSLHIPSVDHDLTINGISIEKMASKALRKSGDQRFSGQVQVDQLSTALVSAYWINNIDLNDLVLLHGNQDIVGNWQFHTISGRDVSTNMINNIPLSNVVTTNLDQNITEWKNFVTLSSHEIGVLHQTNGEYLRELYSNLVTIDTDQPINGWIKLMAPAVISGNLNISRTINNGISLHYLDAEAVKVDGHQDIFGTKTFLYDVGVSGDISVDGLINGIDLTRDVVTTSTNQTLSGNIEFISPVTFSSISSGLVNDLDFNRDLVLSHSDQVIEGHKIFQNTLTVGNIATAEGVKINDVNVAEEAKMVIKHDGGVINNLASFHHVEVLGNLTATSGINGYMISDLPTSVWLKSWEQHIETPIVLPTVVVFNENVVSGFVNDLNLHTDVVPISGGTVLSEKKFINQIHIEADLGITPGHFLSGFDFSQFKEQMEIVRSDERLVYGNKIISTLEVSGNVIVDSVNRRNFATDVLFVNLPQEIYGDMEASTMLIKDHLSAAKINVEWFKEASFSNYIQNAVLKDQVSLVPIMDKTFSDLEAWGVSSSGNGQIDGIVPLDMMLRSVMLDTPQFITGSKTFLNSIHLLMPSTAVLVNGRNLTSHVSKVIFHDEPTIITGKKYFAGSVGARKVELSLLNSMNLSVLVEGYVSKTKDFTVPAPYYFKDGVEIVGSLVVDNSSTLDGIFLDEVVKTYVDETLLHPVHFLSDVHVKGETFVGGLVNGCDLNKVFTYGLRTFHDSAQVFHSPAEFNQLEIIGNVHVLDSVNNISLETLKNIAVGSSGYQIVGDLHIYPGISATNIEIKGTLNGSDIDHVLRDAVLNSAEQVIYGNKHYAGDLEVDVLSGKADVFLLETLNSVKLDDVVKSAVTKTALQVIGGDKAFKKLRADNATVLGFINGIKLPHDIVLTDGPEHISAPVFIKKDITIRSNLTVLGTIGGVHLDQFVNSLVTLSGNQSLVSDITFFEDVIISGGLEVDGMINDVYLPTVVTSRNPGAIEGSKSFMQTLRLNGNLHAQLVNAVDISLLSRSVIYRNLNETLPSQLFTQPIYILNELSVDVVNGVSMDSIKTRFLDRSTNLNMTMGFFKELGGSHSKMISHQISAVANQFSKFAYFVLHQEINLGSTTRILHGFVHLFPNSFMAVAHVRKQHCLRLYECCNSDYSYWMMFDKMAKAVITSGPEVGRFFPALPLRTTSVVYSKGLVVWSNATLSHSNCCNLGNQQTIIGAINNIGVFEPYLKIENSMVLVDVKSFKEVYTYIVAAYHYDSKNGVYGSTVVYRGHDSNDQWREYQVLPSYGTLSMDLATDSTTGEIMLSLGSGVGTYPDSYSSVYRWNTTNKIFELVWNIPSQYAKSTLWIKQNNSLLLAISNLDAFVPADLHCSGVLEGGQIDVHAHNYGRFDHVQSVHLSGVVSMASFTLSGETYLAAASSQLQKVVIYQWKGYQRFVDILSIPFPDVQHLNIFWQKDHLYMSATSGSGSSMLWKAVLRGQMPRTEMDAVEGATELGDQPFYTENSSSC